MEWLAVIEEELRNLIDPKVRLVLETARYIFDGGGKRLRPLLTVLSCGMCGGDPERAVPLGVGLEYIHTASLLHDDVVDGAGERRGRGTANRVFGNEVAVLTGDYMYAKALNLFATYGDLEMIKLVSRAVMEMAEAQVLELSKIGDLITEEEYFSIIDGKTGVLFGACMAVGGMAAGYEDVDRLWEMGLRLGRAFQLIDDLLDYAGESSKTGKPVGNDLREGKVTYPLISVIDLLDQDEVLKVIRKREPSDEEIMSLRKLVLSKGGCEFTRERAILEINEVRREVERFDRSDYRDKVLELIDFVVVREL
jgi:octaprenyl-diphosphate synthase